MKMAQNFSIIFFLLFASKAIAQTCKVTPDKLSKMLEIADQSFKNAHVTMARTQISEYCQRNTLLRSLRTFPVNQDYEFKSTEELEQLALKNFPENDYKDPWRYSLLLTANTTLKALHTSPSAVLPGDSVLGVPGPMSVDEIRRKLQKYTPIETKLGDLVSQRINLLEKQKIELKNPILTALAKPVACLDLDILIMPSCSVALNEAHQKMAPKGTPSFVHLPLWRKVLLDKKYDLGLQKAAIKILQKFDEHGPVRDNIFDDLKSSFTEAGMKEAESEDAAFDILGLISSGGANTGMRLNKLSPSFKSLMDTTKGLALTAIAGALPHLDYINMKNRRPLYSFPKEAPSSCNSGKSYHFWMAAYLSRSLVKESGRSPEAASAATYIANKGYALMRDQANSIQVGKNQMDKILSKEPFDSTHQVVRMDLASAAVGSQFGVARAAKLPMEGLSVDETFIYLLESAPIKDPEGNPQKNPIRRYIDFQKTFVPDNAYHFAKSKLKK